MISACTHLHKAVGLSTRHFNLFCQPLMTGTKLLTVVPNLCHLFWSIWQCASSLSYCKTETVEHQWDFSSSGWLPDRQNSVQWSWRCYLPVLTSPLRFPQGSVHARSPTVHNLHWWPYQCPVPIQSPIDYQTLQAEIDLLSDWILSHKLQLNCDKCKCMLVTRKRDSTMQIVLLTARKSVLLQYLWIQSPHISTLCSKARQQIGMLYHKFFSDTLIWTL